MSPDIFTLRRWLTWSWSSRGSKGGPSIPSISRLGPLSKTCCWDAAWKCEPWKSCPWWPSRVLHTNSGTQALCLALICITEEAASFRVETKSKSALFNKLVNHQRAAHLLFTVRLELYVEHNCVSLHNYSIACPRCRQRREGIHLLLPESCLQLFVKP